MPWDELSIEPEEHVGWIALRRARGEGDHARGALLARRKLPRETLVAALTATPWCAMRGGRLVIASDVACQRLAAVVEDMLACFQRDGSPDVRLEQVKACLAADFAEHLELARVSWWHCAWLDVAVREDAADAARSAGNLWTSDVVTIPLHTIRRRCVEELAHRMGRSQTAATSENRRLSASARARRDNRKGKRKSG